MNCIGVTTYEYMRAKRAESDVGGKGDVRKSTDNKCARWLRRDSKQLLLGPRRTWSSSSEKKSFGLNWLNMNHFSIIFYVHSLMLIAHTETTDCQYSYE
jgi:hypothetical protein